MASCYVYESNKKRSKSLCINESLKEQKRDKLKVNMIGEDDRMRKKGVCMVCIEGVWS